MQIKFGTDGWRAIIAQDYTFENLHLVSRGAALYFKKHPKVNKGVMIGYDARFMSREFAEFVARVFAAEGIKVYVANSIVTTPATSLAVVKKKLAGAIMITASHNPGQYNGFKVKGEYGGAALPSAIAVVEKHTNSDANLKACQRQWKKGLLEPFADLLKSKKVIELDAKEMYLDELRKIVDLKSIERSGLKIAYDPMYGAGIKHLEHLLVDAVILHDVWNPGFGGTPPEPLPKNTEEISHFVAENKFDIGLVTDGDGDRIGAIDETGQFFSSQMILCLLLKYLVEVRKKRGMVVVSQSVTSMIDKMCEKYGLELHRTPVGFKYITEYMLKGGVLIGGEESGGIGIPSIHIPERDGIFNGLLLGEICAHSRKTLGELVAELEEEYGAHKYDRYDFHTTDERKALVLGKAQNGFGKIGGMKVVDVSTVDGFKWQLEGGAWFMLRSSGTEPLLRYYAEAPTDEQVQAILAFAKKL